MHALRSYRLVPVLLALSLALTAATPLIQHSCGMTEAEMATMPCCDGKARMHDAPATHGGMTAMHEGTTHGPSTEKSMPCHDAPSPSDRPAPCPDDGPALHGACCFTADAPTAPTPERLQLSPPALVALVAAFVLPTPPSVEANGPPLSGSPPPAPVARHVLYGSFLT